MARLRFTTQVILLRRKKSAAWVVQPWVPRKRKPLRRPVVVQHRRKVKIAGIIGARAFLLPPSKAWNWNGQAALLGFTLGTVSKAWNWHAQPGVLNFSLGTVSKAWVWAANTAKLNFTLVAGQAWNWVGRARVTGGNIPGAVKHAFDVTRQVVWGVARGVIDRYPLS